MSVRHVIIGGGGGGGDGLVVVVVGGDGSGSGTGIRGQGLGYWWWEAPAWSDGRTDLGSGPAPIWGQDPGEQHAAPWDRFPEEKALLEDQWEQQRS